MSELNQLPQTPSEGRSGGFWKGVLIVLVAVLGACVLCIVLIAADMTTFFASAFMAPTRTPFAVSSAIANQVMSVQDVYNGQELFNSPRAMGQDEKGNIYSADYSNCHVNIFDAYGKFLRALKPACEKALNGMVVTPGGTVYISQAGRILRLDAQGNGASLPYDEAANGTGFLGQIFLEKSGSLLAADIFGNILRFDLDGTVKLVIKSPFKINLKKEDLNIALAEDRNGNIYALGMDSDYVLKLSADGKFINKFGGENRHHVVTHIDESSVGAVPSLDPGYFYLPATIAVDGYGRIFVGDRTFNVQVFDADEKFVDSFMFPDYIRGMMVDPDNNLYISTNTPEVIKLAVKAP